jgi:molybdopterin-synthase adenylyltransferase
MAGIDRSSESSPTNSVRDDSVSSADERFDYATLVMRNGDYVAGDVQQKLRETRLLFGGLGIGSSAAELAARMGIEHFLLADLDTVGLNNLNRQFFSLDDVGESKVGSIAKRIRAINPRAEIVEAGDGVTGQNVADLVAWCTLAFDTIDFLELAAIVSLHDECRRQKKPIITALSMGWGAGCIYFPPDSPCSFRDLFGLPKEGPVDHISYVDAFSALIGRLERTLDATVINAVKKALTVMEDGKPCPASQVAPGSFSVAAMAGTMLYRLMAGLPVKPAPHLLLLDMAGALTAGGIDLLE